MPNGSRIARAAAVAVAVETALARTWSDLCEEFGTRAVRTARDARLIESVLPGIYGSAGRCRDFAVRALALTTLAGTDGRVTGLAAAHIWGITDEPPARITLQVPRQWHVKVPGWARLLRVPHDGQTYTWQGVSVVGPADAVVQVWREAGPEVGAAIAIEAVRREIVTPAELRDALKRRKQMPKRAILAELISVAGAEVTSYLEWVAWREVFPPRLFPQLRWQVEIRASGRKRIMDAFDPDAMINLEFDGGGTHAGLEAFESDRRRDSDMRGEGIEPLRLTYRDLTQRPEWCRQQYRELRAARVTVLR